MKEKDQREKELEELGNKMKEVQDKLAQSELELRQKECEIEGLKSSTKMMEENNSELQVCVLNRFYSY